MRREDLELQTSSLRSYFEKEACHIGTQLTGNGGNEGELYYVKEELIEQVAMVCKATLVLILQDSVSTSCILLMF